MNIYDRMNKMQQCVFLWEVYKNFPPHVKYTIYDATLQASQPFKKTVSKMNYWYGKDLHDNNWAGGGFIEMKEAIFYSLNYKLLVQIQKYVT